MIRTGQLMLVLAAVGLWVAARLTWVTVTSADGLGQPKTTTLSGGTWSTVLIPLAVLLLAAAIAGLAVHGWGLRVVADSNGPYEYNEAANKAKAVLNAIAAAETLSAP